MIYITATQSIIKQGSDTLYDLILIIGNLIEPLIILMESPILAFTFHYITLDSFPFGLAEKFSSTDGTECRELSQILCRSLQKC